MFFNPVTTRLANVSFNPVLTHNPPDPFNVNREVEAKSVLFNLAGIAIKNGRDLPVTRTVQMAFLDLTNRRQNLRILDFSLGLDLPFLEPNVV